MEGRSSGELHKSAYKVWEGMERYNRAVCRDGNPSRMGVDMSAASHAWRYGRAAAGRPDRWLWYKRDNFRQGRLRMFFVNRQLAAGQSTSHLLGGQAWNAPRGILQHQPLRQEGE